MTQACSFERSLRKLSRMRQKGAKERKTLRTRGVAKVKGLPVLRAR